MILFTITGYLLLAYLTACVLLPFVFSIGAWAISNQKSKNGSSLRKLLVLIPAYKEDAVIVNSAKLALEQNYPSALYDVVVIADGLKESTLHRLSDLDVNVLKVSFNRSTKVKALNQALKEVLTLDHEGVVILDADNVMESNFLKKINAGFEEGMVAIQGQRKAKNTNTNMAFLDGASEDINNHIYCKGAYKVGLSSRLAGSGMAFKPEILLNALKNSDAIGGFDKEMELNLTSNGIRIHYVEDAIVYDEKVSHGKAFTNQRSRWIQAQYKYLGINIKHGLWKGLIEGNYDYLHKVFVLALPPRLLFPFILLTASFASTIIVGFNGITTLLWTLLFLNIVTFIIAIPSFYFRKENLRKWLSIFIAVHQTIKAISRLSKAKTTFIHTPHGSQQ